MTIDVIDKLHESGDLRELVLAGMMSTSILSWRKIYHAYNKRLNDGAGKYQSVLDTASTFDVSERTVFRVIEKMTYEQPTKN